MVWRLAGPTGRAWVGMDRILAGAVGSSRMTRPHTGRPQDQHSDEGSSGRSTTLAWGQRSGSEQGVLPASAGSARLPAADRTRRLGRLRPLGPLHPRQPAAERANPCRHRQLRSGHRAGVPCCRAGRRRPRQRPTRPAPTTTRSTSAPLSWIQTATTSGLGEAVRRRTPTSCGRFLWRAKQHDPGGFAYRDLVIATGGPGAGGLDEELCCPAPVS
jgi:hypothetical protein